MSLTDEDAALLGRRRVLNARGSSVGQARLGGGGGKGEQGHGAARQLHGRDARCPFIAVSLAVDVGGGGLGGTVPMSEGRTARGRRASRGCMRGGQAGLVVRPGRAKARCRRRDFALALAGRGV